MSARLGATVPEGELWLAPAPRPAPELWAAPAGEKGIQALILRRMLRTKAAGVAFASDLAPGRRHPVRPRLGPASANAHAHLTPPGGWGRGEGESGACQPLSS